MRYVICRKDLAVDNGFDSAVHRVNGNLILLNEKEIVSNTSLSGADFEEKTKSIMGNIYSHEEINQVLNEGGWNK